VKHHLTKVYDKLGVSNRLELALSPCDGRFDAALLRLMTVTATLVGIGVDLQVILMRLSAGNLPFVKQLETLIGVSPAIQALRVEVEHAGALRRQGAVDRRERLSAKRSPAA